MNAFLILEDGHVFEGKSFGAQKEVICEVVFNTSMTGYLEVLTGQIGPCSNPAISACANKETDL